MEAFVSPWFHECLYFGISPGKRRDQLSFILACPPSTRDDCFSSGKISTTSGVSWHVIVFETLFVFSSVTEIFVVLKFPKCSTIFSPSCSFSSSPCGAPMGLQRGACNLSQSTRRFVTREKTIRWWTRLLFMCTLTLVSRTQTAFENCFLEYSARLTCCSGKLARLRL